MEPTQTGAIRVTAVGTVGIPVNDQDRALDFYVGVLGLTTELDVPTPGGGRWVTVAPRGSTGTTLALVVAHDGVPAGVETGVRLLVDDAETAREALRTAGAEVGELLRWPGVPAMFAFRDSDGNGLEMVEAGRPPA